MIKMKEETPWRDEERLETLYWEQGMTIAEISAELGCCRTTVQKWLDKYDIKRRQGGYEYLELQDTELLRELYHDKGMTSKEIADKIGCAPNSVRDALKRNGIETRKRGEGTQYPILYNPEKLYQLHMKDKMLLTEIAEMIGCSSSAVGVAFDRYDLPRDRDLIARRRRENARYGPPKLRLDYYGYEIVTTRYKGKNEHVKIHRLLAVAKYGFDKVKDKVVHHRYNIPWLNTYGNIRLMTHSTHGKHHVQDDPSDWPEPKEIISIDN